MLEFIVTFAFLFPIYALFGQFVGNISLSDNFSPSMRVGERVDPLRFVPDKIVPDGMTKKQVYIVVFVFFWPIILGFALSVFLLMLLKDCMMSFVNFFILFKIIKTLFIKAFFVDKKLN